MLHHEGSPEKPQYNITIPPFLDKPPILPNPPMSSKNFQTPPFPSILKKLNPPPFMKGGGGSELCSVLIADFHVSFNVVCIG